MYPAKLFFVTLSFLILAIMFMWCSSGNASRSVSGHYLAGTEFLKSRQPGKAADEFENAFRIKQNEEKIHYCLGVTLLRKISPPEYQRLIELFSDLDNGSDLHSGSSLYWLGVAYEKSRDYNKALVFLAKAKEKESLYVSQQEIENAIQSVINLTSPGGGDENQADWRKDLVVFAVILFLAFCFVFGLNKWVLVPISDGTRTKNRFYSNNIFIYVVVMLILFFSALAMNMINGEQFMNLIKIIMESGLGLRGLATPTG